MSIPSINNNSSLEGPHIQDSIRGRVTLLFILMLVALNLRVAFISVDPVLSLLKRDLHLNEDSLGFFAILPVMLLGIASVMTPYISNFFLPTRILFWALLLAVVGIFVRSYCGDVGLYLGMVGIGLGLGITGTILVGIIKRMYAERAGIIMGGYVAVVSLSVAIGSYCGDIMVRLLGGWKLGLAFWSLPLLITAGLWHIYVSRHQEMRVSRTGFRPKLTALMAVPMAWYITLFYLFRVAGAYLLTIWVPNLMLMRGMSLVDSGAVFALATIVQIPAAFTATWWINLLGERKVVMIVIPLSVIGVSILLFAPLGYWILASCILGYSIGVIFSVGMQLMVTKTADESTSLELTSMAQSIAFIVGSLCALAGSFVIKWEHPYMGIMITYIVYSCGSLLFGIFATGKGKVESPSKSKLK